ncbi:MAG: hypothetical protein MJ050_00715 [Phascolarctobacterium sp.]|nr:hypothetical protein [Phascolarctobacterium sp.]
MHNIKKQNKKNYKTGKDVFSRYNGVFYFVGGCVISVPFTVALIVMDRILGM